MADMEPESGALPAFRPDKCDRNQNDSEHLH